jgi:2,4-dienoyl-CoA reductase-like NADH-dependent reductase (Old Yellow Enzyme family)
VHARAADRAADPARRPLRLPPAVVAPSRCKSPITPFTPRALSRWGIDRHDRDFARCAALAREAGYDGVEIMGSEGYLINQFLAPRTNQRTDAGAARSRTACASPVEIVRRTREAVGPRLHHHLPLSMLDLVEGGQTGTRSSSSRKRDRGRRRDDHQHRHRLARGARADDHHAWCRAAPSPG